MRETTKACDLRRARGDYDRYLVGRGIDVGAGDDPLQVSSGEIVPWDKHDGDAQFLAGVPDESFDFVFSSHCLEHLEDVRVALSNWSRVLRTGGHVYVVVPDYTLYEHHRWPSVYNGEHKHSFSLWLTPEKVRRQNHWLIGEQTFARVLRSCSLELVEAELQDSGYDYNCGPVDQTLGGAMAQILFVARKVGLGAADGHNSTRSSA